ncbi:MAG TPA: hypothetical protein PLT48_18945 [Nitrospira sp.]|nr:hypothetical protein [Nitrospira sp.]
MKHIAVLIIAGGATWDRGTKATAGNGAVVTARPNSLRSCVHLTDDITHPNCAVQATSTLGRRSKGLVLF